MRFAREFFEPHLEALKDPNEGIKFILKSQLNKELSKIKHIPAFNGGNIYSQIEPIMQAYAIARLLEDEELIAFTHEAALKKLEAIRKGVVERLVKPPAYPNRKYL